MFARGVPAVKALYDAWKDDVRFLLVYVREAHAAEEWVMPDNDARGLNVPQPQTVEGRAGQAAACVADFSLDMPTVVDGIDDRVMKAYGGWPDRLYVIDERGRIAYQGGVGPFGFKPAEVGEHLAKTYGR